MTYVKVILPTIEAFARQIIHNFKYKSNTGKYGTYRYIVNSNSVEYSILTIVI